MKRSFITAILFAITASNVSAQQVHTTLGSTQQYGVPSGYQSYQTQIPQHQLQSTQPRYSPHQTLQANQHQGYVPQQGSMQTYYYPHQQPVAGGVVSPSLSTAPAQMESVLQRVEAEQSQAQKSYLALPTKSRPPAPSIPPQPEDLVRQSVERRQQSVVNSQSTHALPSKALAPAPTMPLQSEGFIAPSDTASLASQSEPKAVLEAEAAVEPNVGEPATVSDLVVAPKASTEQEPTQLVEERVVEELAVVESSPATEEPSASEVLSDTEQLSGTTELAGTEESLDTEQISDAEELIVAEENAEQRSGVAMGEFGLGDEGEPSEPKIEELALEEPEAEDSAVASVAPSVISNEAEITRTQSPAKTPIVAPLVSTKRSTDNKVAKKNTAPVKVQRSTSYGGWMLGLLLILALPFVAWLAIRKKRQNDLEARFAEAALHRVNSKTSKSSATKTASPKPAAKPVAKQPAVAPVAATLQTRSAQTQRTKKTPTRVTSTPSKDVAAAGVLSMDDLDGVDLTGSDVAGKTSSVTAPAKAEPKSTSGAEVATTSSAMRTEIPTEIVNIADRDNLTLIAGIDDATQHVLYKSGYLSFGDLAKASDRELQLALSKRDHEFSSSDFKRWSAQATLAAQGESITSEKQEVASVVATETPVASATEPVAAAAKDDLTKIRGVGPATAELLQANGITNFGDLSKAGTPRLQEILGSGGAKFAALDPSMWCRQAEFAISGSWLRSPVETEPTNKDSEVDSAWKPTAKSVATKSASTASDASQDDLTKIAGINSEVQELLLSNGVQRFEQIGKMTVDQLNQMLATGGSQFQGLLTTTWPVQARALTMQSTEESVLDEVNSIIDIAKSSAKATMASEVDAVAKKVTSKQ